MSDEEEYEEVPVKWDSGLLQYVPDVEKIKEQGPVPSAKKNLYNTKTARIVGALLLLLFIALWVALEAKFTS